LKRNEKSAHYHSCHSSLCGGGALRAAREPRKRREAVGEGRHIHEGRRADLLQVVTGYFDNSPKNKYNPDPTRAVRFGEPTYDEMMGSFIDYMIEGQPLKPVALGNGR